MNSAGLPHSPRSLSSSSSTVEMSWIKHSIMSWRHRVTVSFTKAVIFYAQSEKYPQADFTFALTSERCLLWLYYWIWNNCKKTETLGVLYTYVTILPMFVSSSCSTVPLFLIRQTYIASPNRISARTSLTTIVPREECFNTTGFCPHFVLLSTAIKAASCNNVYREFIYVSKKMLYISCFEIWGAANFRVFSLCFANYNTIKPANCT